MATQKLILYFLAGPTATVDETADIAALNALAAAPYVVRVLNGAKSADYGAGPLTADFAAGTVPSEFSDVPVFDVDAPPASPNLPATQAIVSDGETLDEAGGGTIAVTVAAGVATYTYSAGA